MKKLFLKFTLLLAVCGLMFVCCDKDETSDENGAPDDEQVTPDDDQVTPGDDQSTPDVEEVYYDVFFPEQDTEFTFAFDAEETVVDLTVCRVNTEGEIEVPVEITPKTAGGGI